MSTLRTGRAQRCIRVLLGVIAVIVIVTGGWIIHRTRTVARQTSLVLASVATTANDAGNYDRGMRFAMLAMGESWLSPESVEAELELMRGAHASMQIALLSGHQDAVDSAAFSPNGRRVVTAPDDKTARVWGAANGQMIAQLTGHDGPVWSAAFSPDGRRVVTASADQTVRVWPIRWLMENRGGSLAEAVCKEKLVGAKLLATGDEAALSLVRGRKGENV